MTHKTFPALGLAEPLLRALNRAGFTIPTAIQAQAIPPILAGHDVLGLAQTGTGKTAAFVLPLLHRLAGMDGAPPKRAVRALILAPTRELAVQIHAHLLQLSAHLALRSTVVLGGVARGPQADRLARRTDILVGTPGRVLDLAGTGDLRLDAVGHFVLDEADRMLDLGFIRDIRRIAAMLPKRRQSLLFSATMPEDVARLAGEMLRSPIRIEAGRDEAIAPAAIEQQVRFVASAEKRGVLAQLLRDPAIERAIVFTRTKHGANRVAEHLSRSGTQAEALHGNKSQSARQKSLDRFRDGSARVLVATDIAARGIDVAGISHVINFDLPNVPESYVHRIGRTARAGARGIAVSLCDASEMAHLRGIEKLTGVRLRVVGGNAPPAAAPSAANQKRPKRRQRRRLKQAA